MLNLGLVFGYFRRLFSAFREVREVKLDMREGACSIEYHNFDSKHLEPFIPVFFVAFFFCVVPLAASFDIIREYLAEAEDTKAIVVGMLTFLYLFGTMYVVVYRLITYALLGKTRVTLSEQGLTVQKDTIGIRKLETTEVHKRDIDSVVVEEGVPFVRRGVVLRYSDGKLTLMAGRSRQDMDWLVEVLNRYLRETDLGALEEYVTGFVASPPVASEDN